MVSAGLTLPNKVPFYTDCSEARFTGNGSFAQFRRATLDIVAANKGSPALLWWTLGNEAGSMQHVGPQHQEHVCLNRVMAWVAAAIKLEDPFHPVGTVVSGIRAPEIGNISHFSQLYHHSVDFIGVNAYGDTAPQESGQRFRANGWLKPFALTETAPKGWPRQTPFGASVSKTSTEMKRVFMSIWDSCKADGGCLGTWPFFWESHFEEWTPYDARTAVGCEGCIDEVVAAFRKRWQGDSDVTSPLEIASLSASGYEYRLSDGSKAPLYRDMVTGMQLRANLSDPLQRSIMMTQGVPAKLELQPRRLQGTAAVWATSRNPFPPFEQPQAEAHAPLVAGTFSRSSDNYTSAGLNVEFSPAEPGQYTVHVFVRDSIGAKEEAKAAFPVLVCPKSRALCTPNQQCNTTTDGSVCYQQITKLMRIHSNRNIPWGLPFSQASSYETYQRYFWSKRLHNCPQPCGEGCAIDACLSCMNCFSVDDASDPAFPGKDICLGANPLLNFEHTQKASCHDLILASHTKNSTASAYALQFGLYLTNRCPRPCNI